MLGKQNFVNIVFVAEVEHQLCAVGVIAGVPVFAGEVAQSLLPRVLVVKAAAVRHDRVGGEILVEVDLKLSTDGEQGLHILLMYLALGVRRYAEQEARIRTDRAVIDLRYL